MLSRYPTLGSVSNQGLTYDLACLVSSISRDPFNILSCIQIYLVLQTNAHYIYCGVMLTNDIFQLPSIAAYFCLKHNLTKR